MTQTAGGPQEPQGQGDGARGYSGRKEDWIANQLRKVYDDALHEPIPKEMLDLLDALDGAVAKEFSGTNGKTDVTAASDGYDAASDIEGRS